jgi:hypothetical protein
MLRPAHEVVPFDRPAMVELEAPVRPPAFRFQPCSFLLVERQRRAVVDRRHAAAQLDLALEIQLLGGFVSRIGAAHRVEFLERCLVAVETP